MFRNIFIKTIRNSKFNIYPYRFSGVNISNQYKSLLYFPNNIHTSNLTYNKHAVDENPKRGKISNLTEKEFLVKIKDDPDTFGSAVDVEPEIDPDDFKEDEFLTEKPVASQRLRTKQYADMIKEFLRKRRIKEAIDVIEVKMLKEDRAKPENYIYNLVIGACGRVGYTKKAFSLYNEMKKRGLIVTPGTYTALFNACANSPWAADGLSRARHLRDIMIEKMYEPNVTNYNAMIKAFGRAGDLETAFALVDEMAAKKFVIKDDTLNFLLQACITDKEAGFRHALLVWRKFIARKIKPSSFSYNLMLRCIRDCGLGDVEVTTNVINQILSNRNLLNKPHKQGLIESGETKEVIIQEYDEIKVVGGSISEQGLPEKIENDLDRSNVPNLMAVVPHLGNILSVSEVTKAEDRLLLVGGCSGFLQNMVDNECAPNIKTFTQLLDNIPGTSAAEISLLQSMKTSKLKPDIDFFNMLIKKRSMRFDYESGKEVLQMIKRAKMRPNLITYGVLALGCKTKEDAISLLDEMAEAKYRLNIEILGAMLTQAIHHGNFQYVIYIMDLFHTEEIKANKIVLEKLNNFKKKCKLISNDRANPLYKSATFQKGFRIFQVRYKTWLKEVQIDEMEDEHPWKQYRVITETDVRHYKDKQEKSHFKPVHTSLYRKTTSVKHVKTLKS